MSASATNRSSIREGKSRVKVVQKHHQKTGELTEGVVRRILTNSAEHHRGIKVELTTGIVGRVAEIIASQSQDDEDTASEAAAVGQRQANSRVERSRRREFQDDRNQDGRASSVMLSDFISDSLPVVASFSPRSLGASDDQTDAYADRQIACSVCTFLNSILLPSCEMCGTALH